MVDYFVAFPKNTGVDHDRTGRLREVTSIPSKSLFQRGIHRAQLGGKVVASPSAEYRSRNDFPTPIMLLQA
jgi:hypothetical protein